MNFKNKYKIQYKFNKLLLKDLNYNIDSLSSHELNELLVILTTHIIGECHEVLQELNWKMHKKNITHKISRQKVLEELVDIDKFLHTFFVYLKITKKELTDMWCKKSAKVFNRYMLSKKK